MVQPLGKQFIIQPSNHTPGRLSQKKICVHTKTCAQLFKGPKWKNQAVLQRRMVKQPGTSILGNTASAIKKEPLIHAIGWISEEFYAERKEPASKGYTMYKSIYMTLEKTKLVWRAGPKRHDAEREAVAASVLRTNSKGDKSQQLSLLEHKGIPLRCVCNWALLTVKLIQEANSRATETTQQRLSS